MASNSSVRSLCKTRVDTNKRVSSLLVENVKSPVGKQNAVESARARYLQVLPRSLHFTFMLVFDDLQTQLPVHSCTKRQPKVSEEVILALCALLLHYCLVKHTLAMLYK